jgi:hypothetical protein
VEVRAGDVVVFVGADGPLLAVEVTAIGEVNFLGRAVWYKHGDWTGDEHEWSHVWPWRHWSEVYPDRPVPGEE